MFYFLSTKIVGAFDIAGFTRVSQRIFSVERLGRPALKVQEAPQEYGRNVFWSNTYEGIRSIKYGVFLFAATRKNSAMRVSAVKSHASRNTEGEMRGDTAEERISFL